MKGRVVSDPTSDSGQSDASVRTNADLFREELDEMIAGQKSNEQLMTRAQELIDNLGERDDPNEFVPLWYKRCRTKVNRILGSMLACSYGCGGGDSQRYVSCAIIACTGGTKSSEDTHRALTELAISWFANFLWICKSPLPWSFHVENEANFMYSQSEQLILDTRKYSDRVRPIHSYASSHTVASWWRRRGFGPSF
jgi:hypothetical protein